MPLQPPPGPDDHAQGPEDSPRVLTMFADFECPFCQAAQSIIPRVQRRVPDVRLVFRHLPINERHPLALDAARAVEAAGAQGRFWEMHDALFELRGDLARPKLVTAAKGLGLDLQRFEADLAPGVHDARIERDVRSAEASGVEGTPAFFAGADQVEGAFDAGSLVDALRAAG